MLALLPLWRGPTLGPVDRFDFGLDKRQVGKLGAHSALGNLSRTDLGTPPAARMMAVTQQTPIDVIVEDTPDNKYSYTDGNGNFREFELAQSVSITASDTPISFARNGASGGTTTTIIADLPGGHTDTYTVTTTNLGMVEVSKVRN